ncbi:MAG: hypothetical protein ACTSQ7_13705 [Alphaproteobacteria bacterium]
MIPSRSAPLRVTLKAAAALGLSLVLVVLAGCTYRGEIDRPITFKATWFSYLNGDDIRAACVPGAEPWYRLVYNGAYDEQLRAYEVVGDGAGGAHLVARVLEGRGFDLRKASFSDPQAMARWTKARDRLDSSGLVALEAALEASGAFAAAPAGLWLASEQFFWIVALCRDGEFHFNVWRYPSEGYARLRFPDELLRRDGTGIAVNPPRKVSGVVRWHRDTRRNGSPTNFDLTIGENGLAGLVTLF